MIDLIKGQETSIDRLTEVRRGKRKVNKETKQNEKKCSFPK